MLKLTEKQKRFCEEYLVNLNATQAYKRAGYSVKNEATARVESCRLLTKPNIQTYIADLRKAQSDRTKINADTVLKELKEIALVKTKISGKEKMKALELLGKHLGMFAGEGIEETNRVKTDNSLIEAIKKAGEEAFD